MINKKRGPPGGVGPYPSPGQPGGPAQRKAEGGRGRGAGGTGVRVTAVPFVKLAGRVAPQVLPAGLLVTFQVPAPAGVTVNTKFGGKVAVTVVAAESVTVQAPVPEHPPPLQPVKVEPAAGAAVSATAVPPGKLAAQGPPPGMPAGGLVPAPAPPAPFQAPQAHG